MDEFLLFYLGVKKVIHQLREAKLIAVTNDTFIKVFLCKSISWEELQTESTGFLKEGNAMYDIIFDNSNADYRAQDNREVMRDEK